MNLNLLYIMERVHIKDVWSNVAAQRDAAVQRHHEESFYDNDDENCDDDALQIHHEESWEWCQWYVKQRDVNWVSKV